MEKVVFKTCANTETSKIAIIKKDKGKAQGLNDEKGQEGKVKKDYRKKGTGRKAK